MGSLAVKLLWSLEVQLKQACAVEVPEQAWELVWAWSHWGGLSQLVKSPGSCSVKAEGEHNKQFSLVPPIMESSLSSPPAWQMLFGQYVDSPLVQVPFKHFLLCPRACESALRPFSDLFLLQVGTLQVEFPQYMSLSLLPVPMRSLSL